MRMHHRSYSGDQVAEGQTAAHLGPLVAAQRPLKLELQVPPLLGLAGGSRQLARAHGPQARQGGLHGGQVEQGAAHVGCSRQVAEHQHSVPQQGVVDGCSGAVQHTLDCIYCGSTCKQETD